jgi:hypothetical protein
LNINDIEAGECQVNSLADIFEHQHALYLKYKEIEGMDWEGDTVSIHTLNGQRWLKDFLWRTTEELTESYESLMAAADENDSWREGVDGAIVRVEGNKEAQAGHRDHCTEELADALHFFVEFCILAGIKAEDLDSVEEVWGHYTLSSGGNYYWDTTYFLGLIANTFKNKPWKQHQMKTDKAKFEKYVKEAYKFLLFTFFESFGRNDQNPGPAGVYNYYFRKQAVNKFRQRSNY